MGSGIVLAALLAATAGSRAAFVPRDCEPSLPKSVRCGSVAVPEDPAGRRTIALNVAVIAAERKNAGAIPLFHLEGGPGIAATNAAGFYAGPGSVYRRSREVVLVDQRGSGGSNPLRCDALEHRSPLEDMYAARDVLDCRAELEAKADLGSYSTERSADDLEAVRQALGYERIDLWAISYGTRLAQEYIKRFPARVAHAVLVGFAPLDYRVPLYHAVNAQRVMDLLLFKCQRDASCSARYPRLREEWSSLLQTLEREAVLAEGTPIRYGPFLEAVRTKMGTAAGQRALPPMIHAAAQGDFAPFLKSFPPDSSQFAEGVYLSIACSEGAARIDPGTIAQYSGGTDFGDYRARQEIAACANWPAYRPRADFFEPPRTPVPILVLAGEMDQVTAPEWAREFCAPLAPCRLIEIPGLGHGPFDLDAWSHGECFDTIAAAFYDRPDALDISCIRKMRPPPFE